MKGNIFEIKRFAVHDGPGIRTTVFSRAVRLAACGATIRRAFRQSRSLPIMRTNASLRQLRTKLSGWCADGLTRSIFTDLNAKNVFPAAIV